MKIFKRTISFVGSWILGCIVLFAQNPTHLSIRFAPANIFTHLKSKDGLFDKYVQDRIENEKGRGGVTLELIIEKYLTNKLQYQTGLSYAFYGIKPARLEVSNLQMKNNPNRLNYLSRHEYHFIMIPFNIRKDFIGHELKPNKRGDKSAFTLYGIAGLAGSYMSRTLYERRYELINGNQEITVNEFEDEFDVNPFNLLVQAGFGLQMEGNEKWIVTLQPNLSHHLFSIYKNGISERLTVLSVKIGSGFKF